MAVAKKETTLVKKPATKKTTTTKKSTTKASTSTTKPTAKASTSATKSPVTRKASAKKTVSTKETVKTPIKKATTEKEKAQRDELIESILKKTKNEDIGITPFAGSEFETPKEFVVVLDTKGNIYQEPVPRYCNFLVFRAFLATFPDVPEEGFFNFKSQITVTSFEKGEIITSYYDGTRKRNNFAECFPEIRNDTKIIGGNLVFTDESKPFTKAGSIKMMKIIADRLNKEEILDLNDTDDANAKVVKH